MEVFKGIQPRCGVLYPLQTMSRQRALSLEKTPLLVEGSSAETTEAIKSLASSISRNVHEINSSSRLLIHMAAVFANNFTNHMVHIGQQILQENRMDLKLLDPILEEFKTQKGAVIPILQRAQDTYGYLPKDVLEVVHIVEEDGSREQHDIEQQRIQ